MSPRPRFPTSSRPIRPSRASRCPISPRSASACSGSSGLSTDYVAPAYEDPAEWIVKEANLPENVSPQNSKLKDPVERLRLARVFARGLTEPSGYVLPIQR